MEPRDLTVIIPTRNGAEMLPTALAHLEVQSCPAARFEVIVVDYGSTGTSDVLERYSAGAPVRTRCMHVPDSDIGRARNRAAGEATGKLLLFLDEDLLAGPSLVEAHLKAQESEGPAAVIGRVQTHPQVDTRLFTKRFGALAPSSGESFDEIGLLDWGFHNLSLPRNTFMEAGRFDEDLGFDGLQDLALAWRLRGRGVKAVFAREAAAYAWRPTSLLDERRRQYLKGYSLHLLMERLDETELRHHFPVDPAMYGSRMDWLLSPLYRHLCERKAEKQGTYSALCERILNRDFYMGYRDAVAGRPARFEGQLIANATGRASKPESARL